MIRPSAEDVLRCIAHSFEHTLQPALAGTPAASTAQTVGHLLRYVGVLLEREGPLLAAEAERLAVLTTDLGTYLGEPVGDVPQATYAPLSVIVEHTAALRERLYGQLRRMQALADARAQDDDYRNLRERIAAEVARQLDEEGSLIGAGFEGHGARR